MQEKWDLFAVWLYLSLLISRHLSFLPLFLLQGDARIVEILDLGARANVLRDCTGPDQWSLRAMRALLVSVGQEVWRAFLSPLFFLTSWSHVVLSFWPLSPTAFVASR